MQSQKWLFVFAHMDDETLCAYDLIHTHNSAIIILTKGYNQNYGAKYKGRRQFFDQHWKEFPHLILDYEDETLDTIPQWKLADEIKGFMEGWEPEVIVTHYSKDLHYEHQITSQVTKVAARHIPSVKMFYEAFNQESTLYPEDTFNVIHELSFDAYESKCGAVDDYINLGYKLKNPDCYERLRLIYGKI